MVEEDVDYSEVPGKIRFEIVKEADDGVAIVKKGKMKRSKGFILDGRAKPIPRAYFANRFIKRTETVKGRLRTKKVVEYIVRWNYYWGEALGKGQKKPDYATELENDLLGDMEIQLKNRVGKQNKFNFDSQTMKALLVVFVLAIPFGIFMDTILNFIPSQVVHWIP